MQQDSLAWIKKDLKSWSDTPDGLGLSRFMGASGHLAYVICTYATFHLYFAVLGAKASQQSCLQSGMSGGNR